jgi:hypothetical protein
MATGSARAAAGDAGDRVPQQHITGRVYRAPAQIQPGRHRISKDKYKDFQLRAEVWVSDDANSGIFIRCEDPAKPGAKTCYECNIYDTRPDPSYGTGAIVYHAEVNPIPKAGGKWNTMEITAKGRDLTVTFNGEKTAQARSGMHTEGPVALQFGEGTVKFRKVEIKPL